MNSGKCSLAETGVVIRLLYQLHEEEEGLKGDKGGERCIPFPLVVSSKTGGGPTTKSFVIFKPGPTNY